MHVRNLLAIDTLSIKINRLRSNPNYVTSHFYYSDLIPFIEPTDDLAGLIQSELRNQPVILRSAYNART